MFGPNYLKTYDKIKVEGTVVIIGRNVQSMYIMSAEEAYVEKTRKRKTSDLWHARLGHVGYKRLGVITNLKLIGGLSKKL